MKHIKFHCYHRLCTLENQAHVNSLGVHHKSKNLNIVSTWQLYISVCLYI